MTAADRERLGVEHPRTSKLGKTYDTLNDWGKWYLFFTGEGSMLPGDGRREDERIIQRDANAKLPKDQRKKIRPYFTWYPNDFLDDIRYTFGGKKKKTPVQQL